MSDTSFARRSTHSVQIQQLRPPEDHPSLRLNQDYESTSASAGASLSKSLPVIPPPDTILPYSPAPVASPPRAAHSQTAVSKNYWRRLGGGSLLLSLGIHAVLLTLAAFLVSTLVTEQSVDFLPGGGSKQSQDANRELAQQVRTKRAKKVQNPVPNLRIVSTSSNTAIALPDLPAETFDLPEPGLLHSGPMASGGFGSQGFGGGSGLGSGIGSAKGVTFFGFSTPLDRVVFILDFSNSMRTNQMDLVVAEMGKTLATLPPRSQYQVILFAGGARFAGTRWKIDQQRGNVRDTYAINRGKNKFRFFSPNNVASDWAFEGTDDELPSDEWIDSNSLHVRETMKDLENKERWFGTDWRWPFKIAMNMSPAPKTIFFMTDGTGGADVDMILGYNKEKKAHATINTFLMHTSSGAPAMQRLAHETGGKFHIVFNDGTPLDGTTYFANRGKYDQLLREDTPAPKKATTELSAGKKEKETP